MTAEQQGSCPVSPTQDPEQSGGTTSSLVPPRSGAGAASRPAGADGCSPSDLGGPPTDRPRDAGETAHAVRDLGRLWEPGSLGARDNGCVCPVLDNRHGLGYGVDESGEPVYVMRSDCPLHGSALLEARVTA